MEKNIDEARNWYTKAAEQGYDDAKEGLERLESASSDSSDKSTQEKQSSGKLSNEEIVERARKKSGAPLAELDSIDPDGTLNIHLYEDAGDHTATWDWYYINPDTPTGHNVVGDVIDLN